MTIREFLKQERLTPYYTNSLTIENKLDRMTVYDHRRTRYGAILYVQGTRGASYALTVQATRSGRYWLHGLE